MGHKLLSRILPDTDKGTRTVTRWRPVTRTDIQADRDTLIALFVD